jgi:hypothetical protein
MVELIILASLAVVIIAYAMTALQDRSFITVLTPVCMTFIPAYYILELLHIYYFGYSATTSAYVFCYATYAMHIFVLALAYRWCPTWNVKLPFNVESNTKYLPYLVLAASVLLYLPILLEFRELIFSPREIYSKTRSGYGHMFFVSSMLTYIAFILMLFKRPGFRGEKVLFFVACSLLCLMHGSKGQVLQLLFIALMYRVFAQGHKVKFTRAIGLAVGIAIAVASLFYTLHGRYNQDGEGLLMVMTTYADYNRNAMMLIDDDHEPLWGELTVGSNVYSRVPRVLYPDKPKDWGPFYLAKRYYPVWFEKETGAASFGILGVAFADFWYFSIIYLMFWAAVTGILLKIFVTRLARYRSPADFIVLLFLAGASIVPGGMGYMLPEHLVVAALTVLLLRLRLRKGGGARPPVESPPSVGQLGTRV